MSDSVSKADKARIVALCVAMEQGVDEDGDIEWNNLPDEVESAVRRAASRAEEQATYDMYYKKYTESVEKVAGKGEWVGEKLVLWNSVRGFEDHVQCAKDGTEENEKVTLPDVMDAHARYLRDVGNGADPGSSRYWYAHRDEDSFNEYLDEELNELEHKRLPTKSTSGPAVAESIRRILQ